MKATRAESEYAPKSPKKILPVDTLKTIKAMREIITEKLKIELSKLYATTKYPRKIDGRDIIRKPIVKIGRAHV